MTVGLLTNVKSHERETEGRHAAQHVEQSAVGNDAVSGGVQRSIAAASGRRLNALVGPAGRSRLPSAARRLEPVPREVQAGPDVVQDGAIGFGRVRGARAQVLGAVAQRQLAAQPIDIPGGRASLPPVARPGRPAA